jgi:hypothetical protein
MTFEEKAKAMLRSIELKEAGNIEEADAIMQQLPLPPFLAKALKESLGAEFLINGGYNLSEAEEKYGSNWLE